MGFIGSVRICDGSDLKHFAALGPLAAAGMEAVRLTVNRAKQSMAENRVPIAGALGVLKQDGSLEEVSVGCNGRIPDEGRVGYPTDHGETSACRNIVDFASVDWANAVFCTSLSPCIMCTRTIQAMHEAGLRACCIAESQSFKGPEELLESLEGMTMVHLAAPAVVACMKKFSERYPWDWAADIGAIPPRSAQTSEAVAAARGMASALIAGGQPGEAFIIGPAGELLASALDGKSSSGGNPCRDAVISAMGAAGSAVNLRECAVVCSPGESLGLASLGACEHFRPAALVTATPLDEFSASSLRAKGIELICISE